MDRLSKKRNTIEVHRGHAKERQGPSYYVRLRQAVLPGHADFAYSRAETAWACDPRPAPPAVLSLIPSSSARRVHSTLLRLRPANYEWILKDTP